MRPRNRFFRAQASIKKRKKSAVGLVKVPGHAVFVRAHRWDQGRPRPVASERMLILAARVAGRGLGHDQERCLRGLYSVDGGSGSWRGAGCSRWWRGDRQGGQGAGRGGGTAGPVQYVRRRFGFRFRRGLSRPRSIHDLLWIVLSAFEYTRQYTWTIPGHTRNAQAIGVEPSPSSVIHSAWSLHWHDSCRRLEK